LFCNQGGFALNAAKGGANKVLGVDIQSEAIQSAKKNAEINNYSNIEFIENDCFDYLKSNSDKFDIIISDPPAFTKSKKNIPEAIGAYYQINKLAIRNLEKNGILLSSSCSHHIFEDKFYEIIQRAAKDNKRSLRLIYRGLQSPDHPILDALPTTKYLKFFWIYCGLIYIWINFLHSEKTSCGFISFIQLKCKSGQWLRPMCEQGRHQSCFSTIEWVVR